MASTSPSNPSTLARDPSSLSNPHEAHITHLSWDAVVDFTNHQFFAKAQYDVTLATSTVNSLRLDTSDLDIQSVNVNGTPATFSLSVPDEKKLHLGSCLDIDLMGVTNKVAGDKICVTILYATSPTASAAQWLPPAQTAGKKHPYVFSACFVSCIFIACTQVIYFLTYAFRIMHDIYLLILISTMSGNSCSQFTTMSRLPGS